MVLILIYSSHTIFYKLSIVTLALERTVQPYYYTVILVF